MDSVAQCRLRAAELPTRVQPISGALLLIPHPLPSPAPSDLPHTFMHTLTSHHINMLHVADRLHRGRRMPKNRAISGQFRSFAWARFLFAFSIN